MLVYSAEFTDRSFYNVDMIECDEDTGAPFKAVWKSRTEFNSEASLYPGGLTALLEQTITNN